MEIILKKYISYTYICKMSAKPPAKRNRLGKLPMDLINKISDINDPKHLPIEIVINTKVIVACRERGITIKHEIDVVHGDDILKSIMPGGFLTTYLRQFKDALMLEMYSTTKIQSKLKLDDDEVIERYRVSLNRELRENVLNTMKPLAVDWQEIQRECRDIIHRLGNRIIRFNRNHELMGLRCTDLKHWVKTGAQPLTRVFVVESYYHPIKKEKVNVSKELKFYNVKL